MRLIAPPFRTLAHGVRFVVAFSALLAAASAAESAPLVTTAVNDDRRVVLPGHRYPLAQARFDSGAVPGTLPMVELRWLVKRSAEQVSAMNALMTAQQTRGSPSYHQWLTPSQFGVQFGADERISPPRRPG